MGYRVFQKLEYSFHAFLDTVFFRGGLSVGMSVISDLRSSARPEASLSAPLRGAAARPPEGAGLGLKGLYLFLIKSFDFF